MGWCCLHLSSHHIALHKFVGLVHSSDDPFIEAALLNLVVDSLVCFTHKVLDCMERETRHIVFFELLALFRKKVRPVAPAGRRPAGLAGSRGVADLRPATRDPMRPGPCPGHNPRSRVARAIRTPCTVWYPIHKLCEDTVNSTPCTNYVRKPSVYDGPACFVSSVHNNRSRPG